MNFSGAGHLIRTLGLAADSTKESWKNMPPYPFISAQFTGVE